MNYRKFFGRKSEEVAKDLLGRSLLKTINIGSTSGRIIQVGAYECGNETPSREGMKYAPGTLFLMPYRGSSLLNISTDERGFPSCVEIREVAFHDGKITGSGAVAKFFEIGIDLDGILLGDEIQIFGDVVDKSEVKKIRGAADNCIGYFLIK